MLSIGLSLTAILRSSVAVVDYSPASLFSLSEPGIWLDPSDLTTLFQDTAGTIPVTGPTKPDGTPVTVALALDKSKGLVLGPELVTNGTFDTSSNWATTGGTISISGGVLAVTRSGGSFVAAGQSLSFVSGRTYKISVRARRTSGSGNIAIVVRTLNDGSSTARFTATPTPTGSFAEYSAIYVCSITETAFLQLGVATADGVIEFDDASMKELPGFHATQATTASRPIYGINPVGGRRNLLTRTEEFENAAWTKGSLSVTANTSVAPDGTTTADTVSMITAAGVLYQAPFQLAQVYTASVYFKQGTDTAFELVFGTASLALGVKLRYTFATAATTVTLGGSPSNVATNVTSVGDGWFRAAITVLCTAATWYFDPHGVTAGSTVFLWGAQLETGSTATAYQKVTTQYDVTEAGVASVSYLAFDTSKFLVTPTITPGVDKVQVFAGVRKNSDAAGGQLIESSTNSGSNPGTVLISAPPGTLAAYAWRSSGSINADVVSPTTYAAPVTNILTGLGDISGDVSRLRINGTQVGQALTDQGTGNYLAYPLYIGIRGSGPTLPFNGQLYSLIVRFGTNLTTDTITSTEAWVAGQTGIANWANLISPTIFARDETAVLDRFNQTIERRAV